MTDSFYLKNLATVTASASATLAVNTTTQVTAASNLTMTLPSPVAGALIVVEREAASTGTVAVTGNVRGAGSTTVTLSLPSESEMFLATASTWNPVAGHKTLGSLDGRYGQLATASSYTADQYFKSGRPWYDVVAFGADPTGVADSTVAIQTAINTALGLRTDTGVSMSGFTVTDAAAVSGDVGKYVNSPNYPAITSYTVAVTASNATMQITGVAAAPFVAGQPVVLTAATAPTGFTAGTTYFILSPSLVSTTFSFSLSATSGGSAITPTSTGTTVAVKQVTGGCSLIAAVTPGVGYTVTTPASASLSGQAVAIGTGSSAATRVALGPVLLPRGSYKTTADLIIQSAVGFAFRGAGAGTTTIIASGAGFTTAALLIDGSKDGVFEGFAVQGDGTEGTAGTGSGGGIPDAVRLDWTTAASRSTSANTFRNIRVLAMKYVVGLSLEGNGSRQLDGTSIHDVVVTGQQAPGSWSTSGNWQKGIAFGSGTYGNNYDHVLYNCSVALCYYGIYCNASGFELYGSQPAANAVEFYVNAGVQTTINGVQSQGSAQLLVGSGGSSLVPVSVRDVQFFTGALVSSGKWVTTTGAGASWLFENIQCYTAGTGGVGGTGVPLMAFNGSGAKESVTLINVQQAAPPSTGVTVASGGSLICINYVQMTSVTVPTVGTLWPLWCLNASALYTAGLFSARPTAASVGESFYYATDTGGLYHSDGSAWTTLFSSTPASATPNLDPLDVGYAATFIGTEPPSRASLTANAAYYQRLFAGGYSISNLNIVVGTASGNVCIGSYAATGSGATAAPGTRQVTTGSVACPAAGVAAVSLGSTVTPAIGDWAAMAVDNATATFDVLFGSALGGGRGCEQASAFPLPSTPSGLFQSAVRMVLMRGS